MSETYQPELDFLPPTDEVAKGLWLEPDSEWRFIDPSTQSKVNVTVSLGKDGDTAVSALPVNGDSWDLWLWRISDAGVY